MCGCVCVCARISGEAQDFGFDKGKLDQVVMKSFYTSQRQIIESLKHHSMKYVKWETYLLCST